MAKFKTELPNDLIKGVESLEKNSEKMIEDMVLAGAKVAQNRMKQKAPTTIAKFCAISINYRTPSDGGINRKVYVKEGYLPFSGNRKYFFQKYSKDYGTMYVTTLGVPANFLAKLYEYGRSTSPFPKKPFMRRAFKKSEIEAAIKAKEDEYIKKAGL